MPRNAEKVAALLRQYHNYPGLPANMRTELLNLATFVERQAERIRVLEDESDRLQEICATAYILAGVVDAPERFLDIYVNPLDATRAQIDALLPVANEEIGACSTSASPSSEAPNTGHSAS